MRMRPEHSCSLFLTPQSFPCFKDDVAVEVAKSFKVSFIGVKILVQGGQEDWGRAVLLSVIITGGPCWGGHHTLIHMLLLYVERTSSGDLF